MNHTFTQYLRKYTKWLQWRNLSACNCEKGAEVKGKEKIMRASLPRSWSQGRKFARLSTICVSVSWLHLLLSLPLHPSSFTSVTLQLSFQASYPLLLPLLLPLQPPSTFLLQFLLTGTNYESVKHDGVTLTASGSNTKASYSCNTDTKTQKNEQTSCFHRNINKQPVSLPIYWC